MLLKIFYKIAWNDTLCTSVHSFAEKRGGFVRLYISSLKEKRPFYICLCTA